MLSSLPLQILFYFNGWWDLAFTIAMSVLFAWKGETLPYPDELRPMLGLEVAIVFMLAIIEYARIFLGTKGNKTEQAGPLVLCLLLRPLGVVSRLRPRGSRRELWGERSRACVAAVSGSGADS